MRVTGLAAAAARYAGFCAARTVWIGMLAGGASAGIAGVGEIAGPIGQILPTVSPGYGFAAIIVAFVGRLHPIGILFAGLLMSLLYLGGDSAQMTLGLPSSMTGLFQGTLLFFLLAADVFIHYRLRVTPAIVAAPARPVGAAPLPSRPPHDRHAAASWSRRSSPARRSSMRRSASSSPRGPACSTSASKA